MRQSDIKDFQKVICRQLKVANGSVLPVALPDAKTLLYS